MFARTIWQDEVVEHPYRYKETVNSDGTVDHEPQPGAILQEGTPQSAKNFNNMEQGIEDTNIASAIFMQYDMHKEDVVDDRLDEHDAEFSAETGTVTLTNSATAFFGFNNSGKTVALQKVRNTMNYDVSVEVVSYSGGQLGDVEVYDRQLNGFKVKHGGSATSVTLKYKVRGGMYA